MYYRFETEVEPVIQRKLKIEINTREHFNVLPLKKVSFTVNSDWHQSSAIITTYQLEELLGTKLRALYQRRKGRDLFDFWYADKVISAINFDSIIKIFFAYMKNDGNSVSYLEFLENIKKKKNNQVFNDDIMLLLSPDVSNQYNPEEAYRLLFNTILPIMEELGENYHARY